jgi:hypothetical protein
MVLDPEGKLVAQVRLPDGFACHAITSRGILGVASNDLGTQQVQLLAVEKARF